jgi:hypothetical protein
MHNCLSAAAGTSWNCRRFGREVGKIYEAGTAKIYYWRFARGTYFERCFSWNVKPKSGLIAVDPRAVDRKLRVAKAQLPRMFLTRRRRDSGRGERRRGLSTTVVTVNDSRSRDFARIFRFHLANCASRPIRATEWRPPRPNRTF